MPRAAIGSEPMGYTVRLSKRVKWQIPRWGLSDTMLVDVYLQLKDYLSMGEPPWYLHRDPDGPGSLYAFNLWEENRPDFQHIFMFRVFFDEDEKHLNVVNGSYWRYYDPLRPSQ